MLAVSSATRMVMCLVSVLLTTDAWAITTLASFDAQGVPSNLEAQGETYSSQFDQNIVAVLPEKQDVRVAHPELIDPLAVRNLRIIEPVTATMSFVHEGAGFRNAVGYFVYDSDSPPQSVADIERMVVFPNASFPGSQGGLTKGDTVSIGTFFPGQSIGFFVVANGFDPSGINEGVWTVYSIDDLNPGADAAERVHSILFQDPDNGGSANSQRIVVAFEDFIRPDPGSDHDFNDIIITLRYQPISGASMVDVAQLPAADDFDNDGVANGQDDYPNDPARAFRTDYPAAGVDGTLAFEDLWPRKGDYDFNDLVSSWHSTEARNAAGRLVDVQVDYTLLAMGATRRNGLALRLPLAPGDVSLVTRALDGAQPQAWPLLTTQSSATAMVFTDANDLITPPPGAEFANTEPGSSEVSGQSVSLRFFFTTPQDSAALGIPPYDSYLVDGASEVHLPGFFPSDTMNLGLIGTADDATDIAAGVTFKTANGLPWALSLPVLWNHPVEDLGVDLGYSTFISWAQSGGTLNGDWYLNPSSGGMVWNIP